VLLKRKLLIKVEAQVLPVCLGPENGSAECREDRRESRVLPHTNICITSISEKGIPGVLG